MQKDINQLIIIPTKKISCTFDGNENSINLEDSFMFLLEHLVLASSKKKYIYLSFDKDSSFKNESSAMIATAKFLYQASFHYFSQTKRVFLDINVIFEKLNSKFLAGFNSQQEIEIVFLGEQKAEVEQFLQTQSNKQFKGSELNFDQLSESSILVPCKFSSLPISNSQAHLRVALGGTFDHLHIGHKILLSVAAFAAKKSLVCGVMDPSNLTNKKFHELLEPLETRIQNVSSFLKLINPNLACEPILKIVPIFDAFGPTLTDSSIDTLVVSQETSAGGDLVNTKRIEKGFSSLEIITVEVISSSKNATAKEIIDAKVSSTSIREQLGKNDDL
ncbi:hypothetical protein DSO57_1024831 [Entomophthora muscae]|uniref:Uncharacterized protein n=1 Tax=Entomophthora muscae TaxID=34485 RepID=A0ACC2UCY0_9FUNG|nr:hypothetical protein DSO57_1024831 [Entomophthora muscae]